ncbi:MAG: hypothetical protein EB034_26565, partial [Verrucomicrobia bacterium]|nr:hypothetical protein [Verrucomicrobiota bacterium]
MEGQHAFGLRLALVNLVRAADVEVLKIRAAEDDVGDPLVLRFTEGPAANTKGEVFFTDIPKSRIHKIGLDGKVSVFAEDTGNANGLMFGPDGRLYACANGKKQITAYDANGKVSVIAEGLESNDLCIGQNGNIYVSDPPNKQVWLIKPGGAKSVVDKGLAFPNGVRLT